MAEKQITQEIRQLKKLKLSCRSGSKERITLHRKIKDLKNQLERLRVIDEEKKIMIKAIKKFKEYHIDLDKFTKKQLKFHLDKLKRKEDKNEY